MRLRARFFALGIVAFGAGIYIFIMPNAVNTSPGFVLMGVGVVLFLLGLVLR